MGKMTDMQRRLAGLVKAGVLVLGRDAKLATDAPGEGPFAARHCFHDHDPVWNFVPPRYARPWGPDREPLFETLPAGTKLSLALSRTKLCLFAGAVDTLELRLAMARPDVPLLVFEPRSRHLLEFLATVADEELLRSQTFLFCGDHARFDQPLSTYLRQQLFGLGYPVFFVHDRVAARHGDWLAGLVENVETLFFRHQIYPVEGQGLRRSLPLRPLKQGLFFDQMRHLYENVPLFCANGRIDSVANAFAGATAVCVAAGPALDGQIDRIRACMDRGALVIAVNNALRTLAAQGLHPHFAVINDTSLEAGLSFEGLRPMQRTVLVAQPLADAGRGVFSRRLFFDTILPELFGKRAGLRLHGSVISTAFSLARHLGCARVVLAGVQLASSDLRPSYAAGSIHEKTILRLPPDRHRWPALCPVRSFTGEPLYATPNFMDARLWLLEEIRMTGLPVVNLSRDTSVFGPGITVDPDFLPEPQDDKWARLDSLDLSPVALDRQPILDWLTGELRLWKAVAGAARDWLDTPRNDAERLALARALIDKFDACGVSYIGQRFRSFSNQAFHEAFFASDDPARRLDGARAYFESLHTMAEVLTQHAFLAHRDLP